MREGASLVEYLDGIRLARSLERRVQSKEVGGDNGRKELRDVRIRVDMFPPEGEITLVATERRWHRTGFIRGIRGVESWRHASLIMRRDAGVGRD